MTNVLQLDGISKGFPKPGGGKLEVLCSVSLSLGKGEIVAITGKSGSGKSTLLSVAALLIPADNGRILYSGEDVSSLSSSELARLRSCSMGFVFQSSLLLADFSALENVMMPLLIQGEKRKRAEKRAMECLDILKVSDRATHRPDALSGGERQRVAIARAMAAKPGIIFADEPTGLLDERTSYEVEDALFRSVREAGLSLLLVTHDLSLASRTDRHLVLTGGSLLDG